MSIYYIDGIKANLMFGLLLVVHSGFLVAAMRGNFLTPEERRNLQEKIAVDELLQKVRSKKQRECAQWTQDQLLATWRQAKASNKDRYIKGRIALFLQEATINNLCEAEQAAIKYSCEKYRNFLNEQKIYSENQRRKKEEAASIVELFGGDLSKIADDERAEINKLFLQRKRDNELARERRKKKTLKNRIEI